MDKTKNNIRILNAIGTKEHEMFCVWRRGEEQLFKRVPRRLRSIDYLRDKVKNIYLHVEVHNGRLGRGSYLLPLSFATPGTAITSKVGVKHSEI